MPEERLRNDNTEVNTEGIEKLDLRGSGITRLRGIGNFNQLKELNIYGLQLRDDQLNNWPGGGVGEYDYGLHSVQDHLEILIAGNNDTVHGMGEGTGAVLTTYNVGGMRNLRELYILDEPGKENRNLDGELFIRSDMLEKLVVHNTRYTSINLKQRTDDKLEVTTLKYLDINGCYRISDKSFVETLKGNLEEVYMQSVGIHYRELNMNEASKLKRISLAGTPLSSLRLNNTPALKYVNVSGCPYLSLLTIAFSDLNTLEFVSNASTGNDKRGIDTDAAADNFEVNIQDNSFTSIPEWLPEKMTKLNISGNDLTGVEVPGTLTGLKYIYLQRNRKFPEHLVIDGKLMNVTGLDLAENDVAHLSESGKPYTYSKKVTVKNAPNLKSLFFNLDAGDSNRSKSLEELYIHNTGITKTSAVGSITGDHGLQIKNMSNLKVLDISDGQFNSLGANHSLQNTGIEELRASNNKFTTFTNAYNDLGSSNDNYVRNKRGDSHSSLEELPKLRVLDLSYNELRDSVHLFKNTELEELYLCHNREHANDPNAVSNKQRSESSWGLRCLNLAKNVKLKKLHYSYTLIWRTQKPTSYDRPNQDYSCTTMNDMRDYYDADGNVIVYTGDESHYTDGNIFQVPVLETIEEIYADYNQMQTTLIAHDAIKQLDLASKDTGSYAPQKLKVLSQRGTNGQDPFLGGELYLGASLPGTASKDDQGNVIPNTGTCRYPNIEYIDFADSNFEHVFFPNTLSKLKYLDLSGNFNLIGKYHAENPGYVMNVTINGNFVPELAELRINDTPKLKKIDISNAPKLCSVQCEQSDPANCQVETVILHHTAIPEVNNTTYHIATHEEMPCGSTALGATLNSGMNRIGDLRNLKHLELDHNHVLYSIDLSKNTKLEYLDVSHTSVGLGNTVILDDVERTSSGLDLKGLNSLKEVYANYARLRTLNHCKSLPNSIETLELDGNFKLQYLNLEGNSALKRLVVRNCNLFQLDLTSCTNLEYLDCSNALANAVSGQCQFGIHDTDTPPCIAFDDEGKAHVADGYDNETITPTGAFWNAIPELKFTSPKIKTVWAGRGNLYHIHFSDVSNLETLDIHNNHINAVQDLSGAANLTNFQDHNNGRAVQADHGRYMDEGGNAFWYYFFQLDPNVANGGNPFSHIYLGNRESENPLAFVHNDGHDDGDPYDENIDAINEATPEQGGKRKLSGDNFLHSGASGWATAAAGNGSSAPRKAPAGVATSTDQLPGWQVYGNMQMLEPAVHNNADGSASGRVEYTYASGVPGHTSKYYLDWTAEPNGVYTGVEGVEAAAQEVTSVRYYNAEGLESEEPFSGVNMVVTSYGDGRTKITKEIF